MNDSSTLSSLVLIGRYPGKDLAVAQALARCMGREESWGLRIISSAPIVFFEKLTEKQARQIESALIDVAKTGCKFEIQHGTNAALPKVGWAQPPKINGFTISEIAPGTEGHPALSANHPSQHPSQLPTHSATAKPATTPLAAAPVTENASQTTATLFVPCPYTGQRIKLTLSVALSRADGGTALNITASAAAVARAPEKSTNAASGTVILPSAPNLRQSGNAGQLRKSESHPHPVASEVTDAARFARKNTTPPDEFDGRAHAHPAQNLSESNSWRRNTPSEIPLPDVPILPSTGRISGRHATAERQPLPLESPVMDLSAFEAGLGVESHEPVRPFVDSADDSGSKIFTIGTEDELNDDADGETLCSVFIERSSSPVVHELVAELHGIPESEASEMCVNGSVALAENIPLFEAKDIKARCAAINVVARIVRD